MSGGERFLAAEPTAALVAAAEALAPTNPFVTSRYLDAQRALGFTPWMLGLERDGAPSCLTAGFQRQGRLSSSFELTSTPPCPADSAFWPALLDFARDQGIGDLYLNSFASPATHIPATPQERSRYERIEYVIDLGVEDLMAACSKSHRERIRKAARQGVELRRTQDPAALSQHLGLHNASIARRQERGEAAELQEDATALAALLRAGAGELFQAWGEPGLMSSVLVLRAARGAYSCSSGNSPEGMKCGASHFLTYETARALQAEGLEVFNRSGARPHETGLREFKERFGARPVALESAVVDLRGGVQRVVERAVGLARRARAQFMPAS